jgi:hypothetical protein
MISSVSGIIAPFSHGLSVEGSDASADSSISRKR